MNRPPLLVILGPTATGKTEVAVELARRLDGEVITADSMQVYRHMDIGTAKPSPRERQGIPHHLIDVADPADAFSVALYSQLAQRAVREVADRGHRPILAGGTGLYIRALTDPCSFGDTPGDPALRRELAEEAGSRGGEALHRRLAAVDPESAARLHPNDVRRVVRALEVYLLTGRPLPQHHDRVREGPFLPVIFGLTMDRALLYRRIEERVERMLADGLLGEVDGLLRRGYGRQLTSMQGLGYKELAAYLAGETDWAAAVALIKQGTRRLAKRQWTWFGRDRRIRWLEADSGAERERAVEEIVGRLAGLPESDVEKMDR